jgi:hypothetical protein
MLTLLAAAALAACVENPRTIVGDDPTLQQGPNAPAVALAVTDSTSCVALPVSASWTGGACILGADLNLEAGDELLIDDARLTIPSGITLTNDGGTITVPLGGFVLLNGGALVNTGGGTVQNTGYWDIRGGGTLTNAVGSTINNGNQIHVVQGTFDNAGTLNNTAHLSATSTVRNTGTITNSGTIRGGFLNDGHVTNNGTIDVGCGGLSGSGTYSGNPVIQAHCWRGTAGPLWSTAASWSQNQVPPAEGPIIVGGSSGPILDIAFTLTGNLTIQLGNLTIGAAGSLVNEGTIHVAGGNFPGTSRLTNEGQFTNNATLDNNDLVVNHGAFTNHGTVDPTSVVGVLENDGEFVNGATGVFYGGLRGQAGGTVDNAGTVTLARLSNSNAGAVTNRAGATFNIHNPLDNEAGALIENFGTLNLDRRLTRFPELNNALGATIVNAAGATFAIIGDSTTLSNGGLVLNDGAIANGGIIENTGVICGAGTITGNAVTGTPARGACNEGPTAEPGGPYSGQEGTPIALDLGGTDPDGDALTFNWDLGDGTTGTGATPPASHPYGDNGGYTITLTVDDGNGGSDTQSTTVTVANRSPTATFGAQTPVDEGTAFTLALSNAQDAAADRPGLQYRFDCGDGFGSWGAAPQRSCPTEDDGGRSVAAEIRDKDGGVSGYTGSVSVLNVAPALGPVALPPDPVLVGTPVSVSAAFTDPGTADTHVGLVDWDLAAGFEPAAPGVDQSAKTVAATAMLGAGMYAVTLGVRDDDGGEDTRAASAYVVVYDPAAGFVTGGGWIHAPAGAYDPDPSAAGKATFGLVTRYEPGAPVPGGNLEFHFGAGSLHFKSTGYQWLVVAGARATFQGEGTLNGAGGFGFLVTVVDGGKPAVDGTDAFRIKIWQLADGEVVFDNRRGESDDSGATTEMGGGSVVIHR